MGASPPVGGRSGPRVWQTWRTPQGGSQCREATTSRRRAHLRMEQARDSLGSREHPELRSPRSEAVSPSGQAEDGSAAGRGPVRRFTVSRDRELAASADENSGACGVAVPHLGGGISQGLRMLATDPTRRTCARWTGRAPPRRWDPRIQGAGRSLRTTSCTAMDSPAVRRRTEWLRLLRQVVSRSRGGRVASRSIAPHSPATGNLVGGLGHRVASRGRRRHPPGCRRRPPRLGGGHPALRSPSGWGCRWEIGGTATCSRTPGRVAFGRHELVGRRHPFGGRECGGSLAEE